MAQMASGVWYIFPLLILAGFLNVPELYSEEATRNVLDRLLHSYKIDLQTRLERGGISKKEFETFLSEITRAIDLEKEKLVLREQGQGERQTVSVEGTENRSAVKGKEDPATKRVEFLPARILYKPYVADPRRPRFSIKWLSGDGGESNIDTAIGGYIPILDLRRPSAQDEKTQVATFAGVWSRWDVKESLDQIGTDFRGGLSLSYRRKEPWTLRLQYFHESDHLGDELVLRTGRSRIDYSRDDLSLGLSYEPHPQYRLYAEGGYGFSLGDPNKPWRGQVGAEWEGKPWFPLGGRPYAAADLQTWEESNWDPNLNLQFGVVFWNQLRSRSLRLSFDLYRGRDPLGEFLPERLRYLALGFSLDY
jgi:Protein of unknown function (DUF1207)